MSQMKEILQSLIGIDEESYQRWANIGKKFTAKKGELIYRPDKVFDRLLFLEEGAIRGYRLDDGVEYTHHFFTAGWFVADYQSYLREEPSHLYLKAVSDLKYYLFEKKDVSSLFEEHHMLEKLGRHIAERAYLHMVERLVDFQTKDLKSRYKDLLMKNPQLFEMLPQKHIASYLGVAEQSLSRIRVEIGKD